MSRLIRDDKHMRVHHRSKGHILTPALKVIQPTRAECLLQWQAENRHEKIFMDEKIFTTEEKHNHQNKDRRRKTLPTSWLGGGRCHLFIFARKG
jgi:hypothetical protein